MMLVACNRVIIIIIILNLNLEIIVSFEIKNHIHKRSNEDENIDEILKGKILSYRILRVYVSI